MALATAHILVVLIIQILRSLAQNGPPVSLSFGPVMSSVAEQASSWNSGGFSASSQSSMLSPSSLSMGNVADENFNPGEVSLVAANDGTFTMTEFIETPSIAGQSALSGTAENFETISTQMTNNQPLNDISVSSIVSPSVNDGQNTAIDSGMTALPVLPSDQQDSSRNQSAMTFQSAFPGLPPITIPDFGEDSWFTYLKAVLDRTIPNPPQLMRNTAPIAEPIPRRLTDLPRGSSPIYLINARGGPAYVPFVLPDQPYPIYIPFNRETRDLMYPYLPLYLPYPNAGINRDEVRMRFVAYIPFQPDRFRNSREGAPLLYPQVDSAADFPLYVDYRPVTRPESPSTSM